MGLERLRILQNSHLSVPCRPPSSFTKPVFARSHAPSTSSASSLKKSNHVLSFSLLRLHQRPTLFSSCNNLKSLGLRRSCRASCNDFFDEEMLKQLQELAQNFDASDDDASYVCNETASSVSKASDVQMCNNEENEDKSEDTEFSESFLPSKLEFLEPHLLGIQREPPEWPGRNKIASLTIEMKANNVSIPLSLRMIMRKQKLEEGVVDSGDFVFCSLKKAFCWMVFIVRELQSYALCIRENLYSEDLQEVLSKVQYEMNASFVWIFQQVFSRTPNLMVYVMLLLANFTVHSMVVSPETAARALPGGCSEAIAETVITSDETIGDGSIIEFGIGNNNGEAGGKIGQVSGENEDADQKFRMSVPSVQSPNVVPDEIVKVLSPEIREMTPEEEEGMWDLMVKEAKRMQAELGHEVLDQETMERFVSPVSSIEIEPDDYAEYYRTDLYYQMSLAEDPKNPLLLSNYAQFLYVVHQDFDRAEECFKRASMAEPPDAEILGRYADFLWMVRKDLLGAEERYEQAMCAAPHESFHASQYATFLWKTGGEETCFPLNPHNDKLQ